MTQGFLLFAYNNEAVDYGLMALWQSRRIRKWLNKPVSIVTNLDTIDKLTNSVPDWRKDFDQIIIKESNTTQKKRYHDADEDLTFHNINRIHSWSETPYDETIVIDTDIIIQSDQLNKLWGNNEDLVLCDKSFDIIDKRDRTGFDYLHEYTSKFYWATVFYFRLTPDTALFFEKCKEIQSQYHWYRETYNLQPGPIRNDFIWSIAVNELGISTTIPWTLLYSLPKDHILELTDTEIKILANDLLTKIKGVDLHVMNKINLIELIKKELELE